MCKQLSLLFETAKETTATIRWLLGVVVVLGAIGVSFGEWLSQLNTISFVSFWVVIGSLVLMLGTFILDWMRQRDIERIPDLIAKLDQIAWDYIDDYAPNISKEDWGEMLKEYGVLLGMDFHRFKTALLNQDKNTIDDEYLRINKAYNRKLNPQKKLNDSLSDIRDMGGLLDKYNIGLEVLKGTPQYQSQLKKSKTFNTKHQA